MKHIKLFESFDTFDSAAVVVVDGDKALLLKRGNTAPWMPNKWNLPGGMIDPGETAIQAATREAK